MGQSVKEAHGQHLEMGNLGKRPGEPFLPVEEASSKSLCGFLLDRRAT